MDEAFNTEDFVEQVQKVPKPAVDVAKGADHSEPLLPVSTESSPSVEELVTVDVGEIVREVPMRLDERPRNSGKQVHTMASALRMASSTMPSP